MSFSIPPISQDPASNDLWRELCLEVAAACAGDPDALMQTLASFREICTDHLSRSGNAPHVIDAFLDAVAAHIKDEWSQIDAPVTLSGPNARVCHLVALECVKRPGEMKQLVERFRLSHVDYHLRRGVSEEEAHYTAEVMISVILDKVSEIRAAGGVQ